MLGFCPAISGLLECGAVLAPLFHAWFDPKRHEDVSHSQSFAKSSRDSFILAFIRVIRGLNVWVFAAGPPVARRSRDSPSKLREFSFSSSSFVLGFAFYYDHEDDDEDDFIAVCRAESIRG
jgi:hypothetical protein